MAPEIVMQQKPKPTHEQCLSITVDHRIQTFFAPVQRIESGFDIDYASRFSAITSFAQKKVRREAVYQSEIHVTTSLALLCVSVVVLHRFSMPCNKVFDTGDSQSQDPSLVVNQP